MQDCSFAIRRAEERGILGSCDINVGDTNSGKPLRSLLRRDDVQEYLSEGTCKK